MDEFKRSILDAVETNQVVLIAGATGCGKTTQVPQYLIDDAWAKGRGAAIMCTQPRRISAVTVSERVATERGEHIGQGTVGYQIRLENKAGPDTSLLFCTNGVLLRRLTSPGADAMLASLSHIVIDELHERDLFADFLTIVLRSAMARHPHLRLVLMSATVRESLFSDYFGGCPVIRVPGYTHPVADYHLEDILPAVGFGGGGGLGAASVRHAPTADPDGPEGQAMQAAIMDAFLKGTDEAFDALLNTVRGVGTAGAGAGNARSSASRTRLRGPPRSWPRRGRDDTWRLDNCWGAARTPRRRARMGARRRIGRVGSGTRISPRRSTRRGNSWNASRRRRTPRSP